MRYSRRIFQTIQNKRFNMKKLLFTAVLAGSIPLFSFANCKFEEALAYNYQNKRGSVAENEETMPAPKDSNMPTNNSMSMKAKQSQEDKDLLSKVQMKVKSGQFGNTSKIQVRVENKVVYLEGMADSQEMIDSLEEAVANVAGVKTVINTLKVSTMNKANSNEKKTENAKPMQNKTMEQPSYTNQNRYNQPKVSMNSEQEQKGNPVDSQQMKADKELKDQVHNELTNNWFSKNYSGIDIQVSNGIVFLHGEVGSQKDKSEIQNRIKGLKGVKRIENNITIKDGKSTDRKAAKG